MWQPAVDPTVLCIGAPSSMAGFQTLLDLVTGRTPRPIDPVENEVHQGCLFFNQAKPNHTQELGCKLLNSNDTEDTEADCLTKVSVSL